MWVHEEKPVKSRVSEKSTIFRVQASVRKNKAESLIK